MKSRVEFPENFADPRLPKGYLSISGYSTFKACGAKYEFSYVKGVRLPANGPMFKGTVLHDGVEAAVDHVIRAKALPQKAQIEALISDVFDKGKAEVAWELGEDAIEGDDAGKAKDAVLQMYGVYHDKALPTFQPIKVEEGFARLIGGVPMIGYMDMVEQVKESPDDPGVLWVSDLKTSKATWSQAKADANPQLTLYAGVAGTSHVRVDNIVQLKGGIKYEPKKSTRSAHALRVLTEDIVETADFIRRGVFPKAAIDSWACNEKWCDYWSGCRGRKT
jgi:RecB family exonuclease